MNQNQLDTKLSANEDATLFSCCDVHEGTKVFQETFPLTVDQMITVVFDDSPFCRLMHKLQNSIILSCEPWRDLTTSNVPTNNQPEDKESRRTSKKQRSLKYTLPIFNGLSKSVEVFETQVLEMKSESNDYICIQSKVLTSGVPLASTFHLDTQYCITRGATNKECSLMLHIKINFVKSGFGLNLLKSTIETNTMKRSLYTCGLLLEQLNKWCKEGSLECQQALNFQQHKQLQYDPSKNDDKCQEEGQNDELDDHDTNFVLSNDNLVDDLVGDKQTIRSSNINNGIILFAVFNILLLILLFLFLFERLWHLEDVVYKYEDDLMNFEHLIKLRTSLGQQLFGHPNTTIFDLTETWRNLINQTETTFLSIDWIYLEKALQFYKSRFTSGVLNHSNFSSLESLLSTSK